MSNAWQLSCHSMQTTCVYKPIHLMQSLYYVKKNWQIYYLMQDQTKTHQQLTKYKNTLGE